MPVINVMIVDDSAFMRKVIEEMLSGQENIRIAVKARNGKDALRKLAQNKVDVITMDIEMPEMNGLEALEAIIKTRPTPVIMLSSYTDKGTSETIKALAIGAVDFILKPSRPFDYDLNKLKEKLIEKIQVAAAVRFDGYKAHKSVDIGLIENKRPRRTGINNIVAIGTSTGGPRALQDVLMDIPENIDGAVLVVQHMPEGFTRSLAQRLDGMCRLKIKEAEDGEKLCSGYGYIAPGGFHMRLAEDDKGKEYIIKLGKDEAVSGHRPSVDVMFESLRHINVKRIVAVIMTGMGGDGSKGMKNLKENTDCYTIVQDEKTSIVFGMPKSAIKLGVVDKVVPLDSISSEIIRGLEV